MILDFKGVVPVTVAQARDTDDEVCAVVLRTGSGQAGTAFTSKSSKNMSGPNPELPRNSKIASLPTYEAGK